ncbi:MAG: nucleoside deaminase [Candidatus Woesearchaeota archaeon]
MKSANKDKEYMQKAISEAKKGVCKNHGGPFGSIIILNNEIIAKAHNEVIKTKDSTAHAEIVAIRRASKKLGTHNLQGCEIYTTSKPCPMCLAAIMWAGIEKIIYGTNSKDVEKIGFKDHYIYEIIKGKQIKKLKEKQIMRTECLKVLNEWNCKTDKQQY